MKREYHKWFSPNLYRDMEMLVFGHSGARVLFFPTRSARFYDYEDWRVIDAIADKINDGLLQVFCVDSVDAEGLYSNTIHPRQKIERHKQYEAYIVKEVLPFTRYKNPNEYMISAGCSLGAYHALNLAFRHPYWFGKAVGMSGRYDLTAAMGVFEDLFEGYRDSDIYYHTPSQFLPHLNDEYLLSHLRRMEISLIVGQEDIFLDNNYYINQLLQAKGINSSLHIWEEEAHKPRYWQKMVRLYL